MSEREAQLRALMESDARIWGDHAAQETQRDRSFNTRSHRSYRLAVKRGERELPLAQPTLTDAEVRERMRDIPGMRVFK